MGCVRGGLAGAADVRLVSEGVRSPILHNHQLMIQTTYREGLMELKTPLGKPLFADVAIKNEDIGFIQGGQTAQVKLAAYPFQKYGLLTGKVVHVSADATEVNGQGGGNGNAGGGSPSSAANPASQVATYKARIALSEQHLISPTGQKLQAGAGMQVAVEIHQGRRTVLEYLLSPVAKAVQEAGREK
jgi:hemolysin D